MTRHHNSGRNRRERDSVPSIDMRILRDHGDPERVDRVWEQIERDLTLGDVVLGGASSKSARGFRLPQTAAGLAAGFALGVGLAGWLWAGGDIRSVVMEPAPVQSSGAEVLAAGAAARTYPLPGGGLITLEPGTIVDSQRDGGGGLTLRLIRGEAIVATRGEGASRHDRLAMMIGEAEVVTAAGRMRVRHDGDTAYLQVLDGSASVRAPHADKGREDLVLGPDQETRVPVRVITATRDAVPSPRTRDAMTEEAEEVELSVEEEEPIVATTPPAWMVACDHYEYAHAARLFTEDAGNPAQVSDTHYLMCLGSGHRDLGDAHSAAVVLERVLLDSSDHNKMLAASQLERIYDKLGESDKAKHYAEMRQRLSSGGLLLSDEGLCNKIEREFAAGNVQVVRSLATRYQSQFPDGACTDTIDQILAQLAALEPEPEDPYEEIEGAGGAASEE